MKPHNLWVPCAAVLMVTAACLALTPSPLPTTSPEGLATIVAATMQAISALTPSPTLPPTPTPTPLPPTVLPPTFPPLLPTLALPPATRLPIPAGATTGEVGAWIQPGEVQHYVLKALQGQPMRAQVLSPNNEVTLSIRTQGGTFLLNPTARQSAWQGLLPVGEDYYLSVYGGNTATYFTLSVEIPQRIQFRQGKDSIILTGKTAGGYRVAYVLFALEEQRMSVSLNGVGENAVLAVDGFSDGRSYLTPAAGRTTFGMKLASSQDYIIQVVPRGGQEVKYTLVVGIK